MATFQPCLAILLLVSYTVATPVAVFTALEDDADNYRIPNIYDKVSYTIDLHVPKESLESADKNDFSGLVVINFIVTENSNFIKLHASKDYIALNSVLVNDLALNETEIIFDEDTDVLTLDYTYGGGFQKGRSYRVITNYNGTLSTTEMSGFYKSSYQVGNETRYLATTHFEATSARQAFPGFDEPSIKATFSLTITVPAGFEALSNAPVKSSNTVDEYNIVQFETTQKMSTYLLAFIVSDFTCSDGESADDGKVPTRLCSRNESEGLRGFALQVAPQALKFMADFTGIKYGEWMSKMDQVAIPDFAAGAMENWGIVTYRERLLLIDEDEVTLSNKQSVATTVTHEFSHQWFGDLVTCDWWSELFLNEGFATYFEHHATAEFFPDWELKKQFQTTVVQRALVSDSYANSKALNSKVSSPIEIESRFDDISYDKGGSVLRMVEHILGLVNFKTGLGRYLRTRSLNTGTSEELWIHLQTNNVDQTISNFPENTKLADVMENWIGEPGYPLVTVTPGSDNTVILTQKRFLGSGTTAGDNAITTSWYVPISYTTSEDDHKFEQTNPKLWLIPTEEQTVLELPEKATWIVLNNQGTGFYRVNYDVNLWISIAGALQSENFGGIVDVNRAQLVDDVFNLAKAGVTLYSTAFTVAEFLQKDVSMYPWISAFNGFDYLLKRVNQTSAIGQKMKEHILRLSHTLLDSVPIAKLNTSDHIYTLNQVQALTWACALGDENCVSGAVDLFEKHKNGERIDPNLRSIVYCNGLRYSEEPSDWANLWDEYLKATLSTEQVMLLKALGCTKNKELLKGYLEKSIADNNDIRSQDASSVLTAVYSGNDEGVDVAFDFLIQNYEKIAVKYQGLSSLTQVLQGVANRFTKQEQLDKLKTFLGTEDIPEELKLASEQALEAAETNLNWFSVHEHELMSYYGLYTNSQTAITASALAVLISLLLVAFM